MKSDSKTPIADSSNPHDTLQDWNQTAPFWSKHADLISQMFAPVTAALIEEARISNGDRVLDFAGGPGDPSLTIAPVVGPTGSVVTSDAVTQMTLTTRSRAVERGLTNLDPLVARADSLPFGADSFDVAVCRFAVMLFADPAASIAEMFRVVKPRGRLALAVWSHREANPFFHVLAEIVSRYVESPPEDPDSPGAFRFASRGKLARLVADAGGHRIRERLVDCRFDLKITPEQYWPLRVEMSDTLRNKVSRLSQEQLRRITNEAVEKIGDFYSRGVLSFPAQVVLVSAEKPARSA
jgi:ubiquinone/menaquinone biosynthesis C-methylase UbiE